MRIRRNVSILVIPLFLISFMSLEGCKKNSPQEDQHYVLEELDLKAKEIAAIESSQKTDELHIIKKVTKGDAVFYLLKDMTQLFMISFEKTADTQQYELSLCSFPGASESKNTSLIETHLRIGDQFTYALYGLVPDGYEQLTVYVNHTNGEVDRESIKLNKPYLLYIRQENSKNGVFVHYELIKKDG